MNATLGQATQRQATAADPSQRTGEDAAAGRGDEPGPRTFRTPVRGHPFAAPPPGVDGPVAGLPARLVREPANPADPHAVAVWVEPDDAPAWRIGYLDRFVASRLAPQLDAGVHVLAELDGWVPEPDDRWLRPLLRVVPLTGARSNPTRDGRPDAEADRPRLWGRPPGVRRRTLSD